MSIEKELCVLSTHLNALEAKIEENVENIDYNNNSERKTEIVKETDQCLSVAEREIERSRDRLDKQGQGPSTSNDPVASENTTQSEDEPWTCDDFTNHMRSEVKQMENSFCLVLWKSYTCRRILIRLKQDLGSKLDALRCLSKHHSCRIELELLNELKEIRDILLLLKEIMCALSTDTSKTTASAKNEQTDGIRGKSRPLQNSTSNNVGEERKGKALVSGKSRSAQKNTLPRWK
eukprot:scaffold1229_cov111-Skeletonema_dohrnii-CCMP3373.AAC.3